jgi:hypothetical protein
LLGVELAQGPRRGNNEHESLGRCDIPDRQIEHPREADAATTFPWNKCVAAALVALTRCRH